MGGWSMRHFKTSRGEIRAIDRGQEPLIHSSWIELSDDQLKKELSPDPSISQLAGWRIDDINAAYEAEMSAILSQYPSAETKTWEKQESEARAYQANSNAETPLVDAIAAARGLDKADLVSRIIAKADAWVALSGSATGKRQRLEDEIKAAEEAGDRDALERIAW